jgi:oligoendopeptidase F
MAISELTSEKKKSFLPVSISYDRWEDIEPLYIDLNTRDISSLEGMQKWLSDLSELEAAISEHLGWLYIKMTCDTQDKARSEAYTYFMEEINPKIEPYVDLLNKKMVASPAVKQLDPRFSLYVKQVENSIRIFREENIPLNAELSVKEQQYGSIAGAMTIDHEGKTLTLQQASNILKDPDRNKRQQVYQKIAARRLQDRNKLDELFNELVKLRTTVAVNSGLKNYRDYKFVELDRFDYTPEDCNNFHASVSSSVTPVLNQLVRERKALMKLDVLKPWDLSVDPLGRPDMRPFEKGSEMLDQSIQCFNEIDPYFGMVLSTLKEKNYTDLDSRIGKAPGGYNYPLYESGVPFIFMNASGSLRDVITMVHEGGHAIHSMLTADLDFIGFKELPSEVAELASMSMELISMEHWNHFFSSEEDLKRAKKEQLQGVIETLPWIACVDAFQNWLYLNPEHSAQQRTNAWIDTYSKFSSTEVDWSENRSSLEAMWQKQLHIFEVPFYYIEYGIAQLGAIAVWRNYKNDPQNAIRQYKNALKIGYSASIPEIYEAAGIRFDFSKNYIEELIGFVRSEYDKL